jgi:hypothetical protein
MAETAYELWERLRPFAMLDIEQLANFAKRTASSEVGAEIVLYGSKVRRYTADEDGLRAAIGAAADYDTVTIPAVPIQLSSTLSINKRIKLVGVRDPVRSVSMDTYHKGAVISNAPGFASGNLVSVTVGNVALDNLAFLFNASSTTLVRGIYCSVSGYSFRDLLVYVNNSSSGTIYAIHVAYSAALSRVYAFASTSSGTAVGLILGPSSATTFYADLCYFEGISTSGQGYGCVTHACTGQIAHCGFIGTTYGLQIASYGGG